MPDPSDPLRNIPLANILLIEYAHAVNQDVTIIDPSPIVSHHNASYPLTKWHLKGRAALPVELANKIVHRLEKAAEHRTTWQP